MEKAKTTFPVLYNLFMKIAEPRVVRILHFGIYICMVFAGWRVIVNPSLSYNHVVNSLTVDILGAFLMVGALIGAVAVLPGVWWLERAGIISLVTGMAMYSVVIIALGGAAIVVIISIAFILAHSVRWLDIRGLQLAPRED